MNRAHRIADQFRNVVGWLGRVPVESQFVQKGFLTPAEFVEAGDQLVYQCPSWQWQSCPTKKNQVFWLPPNKQYLLTRNIPCRHRVGDWDSTLYRQSRVTSEGWLVPGPQPATAAEESLSKSKQAEVPPPGGAAHCTVQTADGREIEVRHQQESCSSSELDDDEEEDEAGGTLQVSPRRDRTLLSTHDDFVEIGEQSRRPPQVMEDDFCLVGTGRSEEVLSSRDGVSRPSKPVRRKRTLVPTRSYDLSITYDKYYQSPRLWLFGYDEACPSEPMPFSKTSTLTI
eukprot:Gregarina_sp_Pseudo_9__1013@NODE_1655_length_1421_cov_90_128075_g1535_i0_p1_GENE_NODE_1655_length_1421_cov_90_128075_g1535_i0NODE_1655_length_1421_cov_90_128075_g1535_i0_p1_ORF_typecomplete_len284_score54_79Autophagy_N/PF03986_13/3_6e32Autophagy_act_C/PF03987_15/1_7e06_NODE_1655_length_1421_cov_90_128075_g1535_i05021353